MIIISEILWEGELIPQFDLSKVLPPFTGDDVTISRSMSPYRAHITDLVRRFNFTPERIEILRGLLEYRSVLHELGIQEGFQWVDGSFVEDVEALRNCPPGDIDVITFFHRPTHGKVEWEEWFKEHGKIFDTTFTKPRYKCDAYSVDLDTSPENVVNSTRYWFGLFSHQRDTSLWKGMVQLPLSIVHDEDALALLESQNNGE